MTNAETLNKAFEKANEYGWGRDGILYRGDLSPKGIGWDFMYSVIFSHDFALAFARYIQADKRNGGNLNEKLGCLFSYWWHDANGHQPRPDEELYLIMNDFLIDLALEKDKLKYLAQFL